MQLLHDRATMIRALTETHGSNLNHLLANRISALSGGELNLIDQTEILIVEPGDTEDDIVRHVGFSPLVEPIDGIRFDQPGFRPYWDWLIRHPEWWELSVSFGGGFAYILLINDADGVEPALARLCTKYTP